MADVDTMTPERFQEIAQSIERQVGAVIVGQQEVVRLVLIAILAGGHCLLEGVPGLGKTTLVRAFSQALDLRFQRIQCTPDLMPADVLGTTVISEGENGRREFRYQPGPVFTNLLLADEINRATPKTQSALLEAMQEHTVTAGSTTRPLPEPFFVLATQNPIEQVGTYPLPEAQLDRFLFKLVVGFPSARELVDVLDRTTTSRASVATSAADGPTILAMGRLARDVPAASAVIDYAVRLVMASHPDNEQAPPLVRTSSRYGSSPRGAQALLLGARVRALLEGRYNVAFDDIRAIALPALRHRVLINFEGEAEGVTGDHMVAALLEAVPE